MGGFGSLPTRAGDKPFLFCEGENNKMVKENSFITIQAFMVNDLQLKGNELLIYAIIHGFSQDGQSEFTGSLQYLADWTNSTKQGVMKALKSLMEKQLILKNETFQNNLKFCTYKVTGYETKFNGVLNKVERGYETKFNGGMKQSLPNNINNNITNKLEDNIPAYVQEPLKTNKDEFQSFLSDAFVQILNHNKYAKHKIPISNNLLYFTQKEGRQLLELSRQYETKDLESALKNYLMVANSDTWKSGFSFNAFCKNIAEYIPEYFDLTKYIDLPKGGLDELAEKTVNEMIEKRFVFRISVFYNHKEEWFKMGMPKGQELVEIVNKWTEEEGGEK